MKIDRNISDTIQLIMQSTIEYNKTIHSVKGEKPLDVLYEANEERTRAISDKIAKAQQSQLARCNASRQNRVFEVGETVFVKNNKRLENKFTPLCSEESIQADLGTSVLIKERVVHKDNFR